MNIANVFKALIIAVSLNTLSFQTAAADTINYIQQPSVLAQAERALRRGNSDRALDLLQRTSNKRKGASEARRQALTCKALYQQQNYERAEVACDLAIAAEQTNWSHYNNRGVMRYKTERYSEALSDFKHAASIMVAANSKQRRSVKRNISAAELNVRSVSAR